MPAAAHMLAHPGVAILKIHKDLAGIILLLLAFLLLFADSRQLKQPEERPALAEELDGTGIMPLHHSR